MNFVEPIMFVKVMNKDMINRGHRFQVGLNEIDNFNSDPSIECAPGIYFCEAKCAAKWAFELGYKYICDVEIPPDAKVLHLTEKSRTDKIILSRPVPIEDHQMWQNEDVCLEAVKVYGFALKYVKNQTPEICLAAVHQSGCALVYVKEQTLEICYTAVHQHGSALRYVKEQTPDLCLVAVREKGCALMYVKEQTSEICLAALQEDRFALRYVKNQFDDSLLEYTSFMDISYSPMLRCDKFSFNWGDTH
jgi:hypothetical protein